MTRDRNAIERSGENGERATFIPVRGESIFGVLHRPAGRVKGSLVFCHPFGEEKLWAHRVFVSAARAFARAGWNALRIDFRGHGDSDRRFEDSTVTTHVEDIRAALAWLASETPTGTEFGLVGLRFGATVAAEVAAQADANVSRLILWDPIVKGAPYMQTVLRINLAAQVAIHRQVVEDREALVQRMRQGAPVNIEGYGLSLAFFEEAERLDLSATIRAFRGRGLVVQVSPAAMPPRPELTDLAARCPGLEFARAEEDQFWKEIKTFYQRADNLLGVTLQWLDRPA